MRYFLLSILLCGLLVSTAGHSGEVWITPQLESVEVIHAGKKVTIQRNQDRKNTVNPLYAHTSRSCPPFCIQPMSAASGVETVGELEVLAYLEKIASGDPSILVVDARTPQWPKRGMIPGAINIPWTKLAPEHAEAETLSGILREQFGGRAQDGQWDFSDAKTLVIYCNGMWCSQSTTAVDALLAVGYPPDRIKWYRGGMQNWENLGLTAVKE